MNNKHQTKSNFSLNTLALSSAIALGTLLAIIYGLPANAQTNTKEPSYLEDIEAGKDSEWNFSGTSESVSIEDRIPNLQEYSIDDLDSTDVELVEKSRRRDTRRGIKDYSVEVEVQDY